MGLISITIFKRKKSKILKPEKTKPTPHHSKRGKETKAVIVRTAKVTMTGQSYGHF